MDKKRAAYVLNEFINEMEHTIIEEDKKKLNRGYAKQVFWKNRDTLVEILEWVKDQKED